MLKSQSITVSAAKTMNKASNLGHLKSSGYQSITVKEELRRNLILLKKAGEPIFEGIEGYADSVLPEIERAILAKHNINLLGLRGQAKTSLARKLVNLLDEYIPVISGSALNEDPFNPLTEASKALAMEMGDDLPISWLHRSERYTEKIATPDVSVADLIGDIDPIKAASLKISYEDERAIHFGLVPRANRGIFVINELPDLQPRIQVALFNILQEGDIQIRGFKVRLPLDIQFVFTANPEDYTNRGSIITPLKDRIQSQIMTHYPINIELSKQITKSQSNISEASAARIQVTELLRNLVEQVVFAARESEFVDQKSGVSARLGVSAMECLVASAEQRLIDSGDAETQVRLSDLFSIVPAITGKIELVYEGEQEGAVQVAHNLIRQAIRTEFLSHYPSPEKLNSSQSPSPYKPIVDWFSSNTFDLSHKLNNRDYLKTLESIKPLQKFIKVHNPNIGEELYALHAEFILHALSEFSLISKQSIHGSFNFNDMLNAMLN